MECGVMQIYVRRLVRGWFLIGFGLANGARLASGRERFHVAILDGDCGCGCSNGDCSDVLPAPQVWQRGWGFAAVRIGRATVV